MRPGQRIDREDFIQEFSHRTVRMRRTVDFSLIYKGVEVEGTMTEYHNELYSDWDQDVELVSTPELDDLSDDDIFFIEDYVRENIQ